MQGGDAGVRGSQDVLTVTNVTRPAWCWIAVGSTQCGVRCVSREASEDVSVVIVFIPKPCYS